MASVPQALWLRCVALAATLLVGASAEAQTLPVNKCAAAKTKCVIAKAKGLLSCHAKAEQKGVPLDPSCAYKVDDKFAACIPKAETKACLTTGDVATIAADVDAYVLAIVSELDPGYPAPVVNACSACKKKAVAGATAGALACIAKAFGKAPGAVDALCLQKASDKLTAAFGKCEAKPPCLTVADAAAIQAGVDTYVDDTIAALRSRFVDNGDGTVTDPQTGLQWERKTTAAGSGPNYADPHDVDNRYTWSATGSAPDGTVFTQFLVSLNTPPCFAGHCDWRVPRVNRNGDPAELETIVLGSEPCGFEPCVDPILGMDAYTYWSATPFTGNPQMVLVKYFTGDGLVNAALKDNDFRLIAVRGP